MLDGRLIAPPAPEEFDVPPEPAAPAAVLPPDQESEMSVDLAIFRRLACGDMVRQALQGHGNLQPLAHDKRIELLLARLSEAEDAHRKSVQVQHPDHQEFARSPVRR